MPPKKKKSAVNPIVVGTVSTRSTRRQSIVNIEIPKYKSKAKEVDKLLPPTKTCYTESTSTSPRDLTDQIKDSYNKMINRIVVTKSEDKRTTFNVSKSVHIETAIQTSLSKSVDSKLGLPKTYKASPGKPDSLSAVKTKFKSNKALLQILEDWTDDDSQDDKRYTFEVESSDSENIKYFDTIAVKKEETERGGSNESEFGIEQNIKNEVIREDPLDIEGIQSEVKTEAVEGISQDDLHTHKDNRVTHMEVEIDSEICEISQTTTFNINESEEEIIEIVVEDNESVIIEEPIEETVAFDADDYIVECVAEEIIPADNEVMDTVEDNPIPLSTGNEEEGQSNEINSIKAKEKEPQTESDKSFGVNQIEAVSETLILEETSQSVSTTDSNDAEVRSYFSKEIEKNENVKQEGIPSLDSKDRESSNKGSSDIENILSEENSPHAENTLEETESEQQEDSDKIHENKCIMGNVELEEILNKSDTSFDETIYSKQDFKQEEILEIIGQGVESKMFRRNTSVEKMDATDNGDEDSLESKVAELHLKDYIKKEEEVSDKTDVNNSVKNDDKLFEEEVKNMSSIIIGEDVKEDMKMDVDILSENTEKVEDIVEDVAVQRPKTRRTRSVDSKPTTKLDKESDELKSQKSTKHTKYGKEKKIYKQKEIKVKDSRKDSKSKKKIITPPIVKKTKEKLEKKDLVRSDKRESSKKALKPDDLTKKGSKSDNTDSEDTEVRRSSRIKSISVLKKKTTGHGLVRSKSEPILNESDVSDTNSTQTESEKSTPSASPKVVRERKTRWTRSSENLTESSMDIMVNKCDGQLPQVTGMDVDEKPKLPARDPVVEARLKQFVHLKENMYKTDRMTCKEAKKMTCDCFLTSEEIESNEFGCGEDCLNRLLLIECGNLCQVGERCTNKRFQKAQFAPVEVFNTDKKGLGLRAAANIPYGEFILEYVGEVLNCEEFDKRAEVYSQDKNIHYYFMSLRADAIIDATMKGNISRFINHSCDPNAETQKWTVNGELRIGFFSTRTILAGEEITFDYRFQRYGKEAQKCYCEAAICRGWLGEQPDDDSEDEDEEDEEEEEEETETIAVPKVEPQIPVPIELEKVDNKTEPVVLLEIAKDIEVKPEKEIEKTAPIVVTPKRKSPRKKVRKDLFEDLDQLDEDIEMLVTTGLKNQAHTLKLSRLMVRAKESIQRTKLLRILRRGELPCRRLFLDYHGLRLMHGYMIDAQHLVNLDKKFEYVRLEMLQTLAVLPIPNKSMLQDSKVLSTVENWATNKNLESPLDSDSNSPRTEPEPASTVQPVKEKDKAKIKAETPTKDEVKPERSIEDQEEEIRFLAMKLLEEWANLKEVFRIPKKERIEQMKEHEREANKKFMQSGYDRVGEQDSNRKNDRHRQLSRYKLEREGCRKGGKSGEKPSAEFIRLSKIERRKLFALQHELKEEERRLKQREMWRQHELNCMMIGTDPRFTAPFDPSRGYQCIWNPQIGQWQNYPLPPQNQSLFPSQPPTPIATPMTTPISTISLPPLPDLSVPPPQLQIPKSIPSYSYPTQMGIPTSLNGGIPPLPTSIGLTGPVQTVPPTSIPQMHMQQPIPIPSLPHTVPQLNPMPTVPMPQNMPTLSQIPVSISSTQGPAVQYQEPVPKEEDPSQVKFMGPIPPPAKLPPKWKCAKDKYGRPYYYHIKIRKSQWEPPPFVEPPEEPEDSSESESSSDTSSVSSDTSSDNSDSDDEIDDTRLLIEVRKQMEKSTKLTLSTVIPDQVKIEEIPTPSPDDVNSDDNDMDLDLDEDMPMTSSFMDDDIERPSIDIRLKEQFDLLRDDKPPKKRRRLGLCEEIIISPRTEEDKQQFKEDVKRYKANKEKLKRQKELIIQQTKKQLREMDTRKIKDKRSRATLKSRIKEMPDFNSETAKKIKENFRSNMASTVVGSLNAYRKPDCKEGKITNTEDFKHLARKLTHFVMLKEMKHIARIEDLTCTDNVKSKAREYIRKYMSKFGEVYIKRNDSPDFKD